MDLLAALQVCAPHTLRWHRPPDRHHPPYSDQARALSWRIQRYQPLLLVVDSLAAACPHAERSPKILRSLLFYLSALAHRVGLAVLVIHHLRKRSPTAAARLITIDDLCGFTGLEGFCRAPVYLARRRLGDAIVDVGSGLRDRDKQWRLRDPAPDDPQSCPYICA